MWGGAPGRFSLVWLWCGGHTEVRSVPRVFTERSEVPLVTLNLCVMRRYNLGEGDLVFTLPSIKYPYKYHEPSLGLWLGTGKEVPKKGAGSNIDYIEKAARVVTGDVAHECVPEGDLRHARARPACLHACMLAAHNNWLACMHACSTQQLVLWLRALSEYRKHIWFKKKTRR